MPAAADSERVYVRLRQQTAPRLLRERAASDPRGVACRAKRFGLYEERTWEGYALAVAQCAAALKRLGLKRGHRIAIMGDATEEWVICDLAAQTLGAISYGIYPTASRAEVAYQLRDGGASIFVAEDQEAVDKALPLVDDLPDVRSVVVIDAQAMFQYSDTRLVAYADLVEREPASEALTAFESAVAELQPDDPAFIVYTSGTTGHPKGALVAHGKHLAAAYTLVDRFPLLRQGTHRTVIFLPLCHVLGRDMAITLPLLTDIVPHYGDDVEDVPATLFEVAPTVLAMVPRYLQKFAAQVLVAMDNTSPLKRAVYDMAVHIGRKHIQSRWDGSPSLPLRMAYAAAHAIAFQPILNKLGLDRVRLLLSGGAPLARETMALWQLFGVNVAEMYGQTETAGAIIAGQSDSFPRPGDVGRPPSGWEVRCGEDREILVRSPDLFEGYWRHPEATKQVLDPAGWLHTGDIGAWDERQRLRLVDRSRDFIVTSGGKTLSPSQIENTLKSSPYIGEALVIGHNRKYLTALIEIDPDMVAEWARAQGILYTGFTNLSEHASVRGLIESEIARTNAQLARVEQIKSFRILPKVLDPEEEGEPVTPTRKLKRQQMAQRFESLVESMYDDSEERRIAEGVGSLLAKDGIPG